MKRSLLLLGFSGLLFTGTIFSQSLSVPSVSVDGPDVAALAVDDETRDKNGQLFRIAEFVPADINVYESGTWYSDVNGNLIYSLEVTSGGAQALCLGFDQFNLPENAELRLYNPSTQVLVGPYTSESNIAEGDEMMTSMVKGDKLIVEVMIPQNAKGDFKLHVARVGYFYRNIDPFAGDVSRDFGDSESCEVNINCSEGSTWQNQKGGSCRIFVVEGSSGGWCSGSLINNTNNDCTPYVLTAQHCGSAASAANFRSWQFHFKYESATCTNPASEPTYYTVTGSLRLSSSGTISNVQKSDFLLVLLKTRPVATASAYYNGWDRSTTASGGGVGIHHPAGDITKISKYSATPVSSSWDGSTPNSHWRVTWVATTNGHGVTEGGSSGSPLFNSAGLIIGDLSGGSSYCSSPNSPDLYGKFTYGWNSCGNTPQLQMAPWLDRAGSAPTTLTGKDQTACATATAPVVDFSANNVYPVVNTETVTISDLSTNSPFIWQWTITPATFTYVNGTNQYSQNPQVQFTATGNYTVAMYAGNIAGYSNKSKAAYIHVGQLGLEDEQIKPIVMYPNPVNEQLFINLGDNSWNMEKLTVSIMDLSGKFILVETISAANGNIVSVNIPAGISNGFYLVKVSDGKNSTTEKLEIVK